MGHPADPATKPDLLTPEIQGSSGGLLAHRTAHLTRPGGLTEDLRPGLAFAVIAGLVGFAAGSGRLRLPLLFVAAALACALVGWWVMGGASRWVFATLTAALLLPPLPLPWGDTGPHPVIALAGLGVVAGFARAGSWDFRWRPVSVALIALWFALLLSGPFAAMHSGAEAASASLARIGLFSISVYLYFYLVDGPGRDLRGHQLTRLLFWAGCSSALFACLDFYYQLPAPSRFAEQFVWLQGGVFRRAQGVFYEASTLGLVCVFLLSMIAALAIVRPGRDLRLPRSALLAGAIVGLSALVLSFSRAAMLNLGVSLAVMVGLERRRLRISGRMLRVGALVLAALTAGIAALRWLLPDILTAYLQRLWYSGVYLLEAPNLVLSRRLESWQLLLSYVGEHPWQMLFGIGYKTLPYTGLVGRPVVADNTYLSLLVETGVVGLCALLLLHLAVLRVCYRAARAPSGGRDSSARRLLGLWMFSFWCGLAAQMWSADVLTYWRVLPALFAVLAIVVRESSDENPVP